MPLSMCETLGLGQMKPTTISLQLKDHSMKHPMRVLENIPTKAGDLYILVDLMIPEMEEDTCTRHPYHSWEAFLPTPIVALM